MLTLTIRRTAALLSVVALLACVPVVTVQRNGPAAMVAAPTDVPRAGYEAFAQGDIPGMLAIMDPNVVWTVAEGLPYGGTYRGPDAVLNNVFMVLGTEFEGFRAVPREFLVSGDKVVVLGEYSGTYKATGRSFRAPFAHVWRMENGRLMEFLQFTDTHVLREAMTAP